MNGSSIIKTGTSLIAVFIIGAQTASFAADVTGARLNIGSGHSLAGTDTSIAGGSGNTISSGVYRSLIGGGAGNSISGSASTVANGEENIITATYCFIGSGLQNTVEGESGVIGGGIQNYIPSSGGESFIGSGSGNTISGPQGAIGGGVDNSIGANSQTCFIGGGYLNSIVGTYAAILGGTRNTVAGLGGAVVAGVYCSVLDDAEYSVVGNGISNSITAHAEYSFIGCGVLNTNQASFSFIGSGLRNEIGTNGTYATIGGGVQNIATGTLTTVPGGAHAKAANYGQLAYASGAFAAVGDAQASQFVLRQTTTNSTPKELFLDGAGQRMSITSGASWSFDILVIGRSSANSGGYRVQGVIENNGGTTGFIGAPTVTTMGEDVGGWDVSVTADNTNDALVINVTGDSSSIRWVANVRTAEVSQ